MTIWLVLSDDPDGQDYFESAHSTKESAEAAVKYHDERPDRLYFCSYYTLEVTLDQPNPNI